MAAQSTSEERARRRGGVTGYERQGRAGSRCPPEDVFGASEQGSVGKGRLGALCEISRRDIRYGARGAGACAARWGQAS